MEFLFLDMDDFVRNKLREWGLSKWEEKFKDEEVDEECFLCLDEEIDSLIPKVGPRAKFKRKLKLLKEEQNPTTTTNQEPVDTATQHCGIEHEETADSAQVLPSTSDANDAGKRKLDPQGECQSSPARKRRRDTTHGAYSEEIILSEVKNIIGHVKWKLQNTNNTKLNDFLKEKIHSLETKKRELVGVFGRTGAGKSSLINAIIGEKLLGSESVSACTSVMIQVEATSANSKYEADIEFITVEEWKYFCDFMKCDHDQDEEDVEELSVLYGDEWKNKSTENLMDKKYFKEIPEFLKSTKKIMKFATAEELAAGIVKYTRCGPVKKGGGIRIKYWWPLVKCVTVRVPGNSLLQHVTLVDLPGNGDCNKSRDNKWKEVVGSCSTVWIVTEMNRAASEKEAWEILENAISLMGNGGECQHIHFICTKSDQSYDSNVQSTSEVRDIVLQKNEDAKNEVTSKFKKQTKIKKHFSDDCFVVYTVSSTEFLNKKHQTPDDTEIPKLQKVLRDLNASHSETLNYVSGAHGILSLIQGAKCTEGAGQKMEVCTQLEEKMTQELTKFKEAMEETSKAFERCLDDGVKTSKKECEGKLKSILYPKGVSGGGYHRILKYAVENNGAFKEKKKSQKNINEDFSSHLTDRIDEEFRTTFPNAPEYEPFKGVIKAFSLGTRSLTQKYKDVELQLTFLETEENKIKTKLNQIIRERKKHIYRILTETIEEEMQECYERAKEERGEGSLNRMRSIITNHVLEKKDTMFDKAKANMLQQLAKLMRDIQKILKNTLEESIELALKTDDNSLPGVSTELHIVKEHYSHLKAWADFV